MKQFSASGPSTQGFSPEAQKIWNSLAPKMRIVLMNNAFCFKCKSETGIGEISATVDDGELILNGICTKCGEPVARVVEH